MMMMMTMMISVLLNKYYAGKQNKKKDLNETCGVYGRQEKCIQGFVGET